MAGAYFRFSLFDGDTALDDFDFNDNTLEIFGVNVGNWSAVNAQNTNGLGAVLGGGFSGGGFRNDLLDTGWFSVVNSTTLASVFAAIDSNDSISFSLRDRDPGDNFFDFTRGIDNSLINIGTGPGVIPPPATGVPEPTSLALVGLALVGAGMVRRRKA